MKVERNKLFFFFALQGKLILSLLFVLMIASACSPERKLANAFVKYEAPRSALLIEPQFIYKENLKTDILDSLNFKDEKLFDSVLMANSELLQFIDDSMFLANYVQGYFTELKKFGFLVYRENYTADFMEMDSNAYVVNIAQLVVEEAYYTQRDDVTMYDTYYYHDHVLSAVYINSWIEVSEINAEKENHDVYFASDLITDDLQGEFSVDYFNSQVKYLFEIDTLKYNDVYTFAYGLGRTYAGYTFDLLLNTYIRKNLPEGKQSDDYWRYDPEMKSLFYATDDKFIPLED